MELDGKRVIVTGGARGLGRATVSELRAKGARVAVLDLDGAALEALRGEWADVHLIRCDVTAFDEVQSAAREYCDAFGPPHVLVNNAGILWSAPLVRLKASGVEGHDVADWRRVMAVNLDAVFFMTVCLVAPMVTARLKGVIVNVSSVAAAGNAGQSAYSAAKAGVNALTATWAKELGPLGIRVLAIAPGFTDTPSTRAAVTEAVLRDVERRVPLRRLGRPEEIARGIVSAIENDFINGKVLEIDGGLTL